MDVRDGVGGRRMTIEGLEKKKKNIKRWREKRDSEWVCWMDE